MSDLKAITDPFLHRITELIEAHLEDESFGVAELADEMSMNRSTLLRRVKRSTGVSVAVFIRQQRLAHAKAMLQDSSLTISEVAYKTGFSSSSYFAKCFREEFGYPPSEEATQPTVELEEPSPLVEPTPTKRPNSWLKTALLGVIMFGVGLSTIFWWPSNNKLSASPKTIAVLPFQNDSPDSSNIYLINGLMVAIIDNLHQIKDLQVTSRTTVERYRGVSRTIPELAEELGVSYFVEGSGQKIEDQILLTLRLIDAQADTLIWSRRYQQEAVDIFQLQTEVSTSIAQEIKVFMTPAEKKRIELPPTQNLEAYDHYLKGLEQIKTETREGLLLGIASFKKAIELDPTFAHPHAYLAISYYFMDVFQADKNYVEDINTYADKALLLDPSLNESLIGKALYYMQVAKYELAIQFFNKVLAQNPSASWVHNLLSTIYSMHLPNTQSYLRHAIQALPYAIAGQDSHTTSFAYLHVGNALAQNGFLEEANPFITKSLSYSPSNQYAELLSSYTQMGQNRDLEATYKRLQKLLKKDTTSLAVLQEVAKVALYKGDYEAAWGYYRRFLAQEKVAGLDIYPDADINIAFALQQLNRPKEAILFQESYYTYLQGEESVYKDLGFAFYYASMGQQDQAIASLEAFAEQEGYQYWLVMFIEEDPSIQSLVNHPSYAPVINKIKEKFWTQHQEMRKELEAEGVI